MLVFVFVFDVQLGVCSCFVEGALLPSLPHTIMWRAQSSNLKLLFE